MVAVHQELLAGYTYLFVVALGLHSSLASTVLRRARWGWGSAIGANANDQEAEATLAALIQGGLDMP